MNANGIIIDRILGYEGGFFDALAWTLENGLPTAGGEAVLVLLGAFGSAWGAAVNFYFGSSASSAREDQLIAMAPPPK